MAGAGGGQPEEVSDGSWGHTFEPPFVPLTLWVATTAQKGWPLAVEVGHCDVGLTRRAPGRLGWVAGSWSDPATAGSKRHGRNGSFFVVAAPVANPYRRRDGYRRTPDRGAQTGCDGSVSIR